MPKGCIRRLYIISAFLILPFLSAFSQDSEVQPYVENLDSLKEVLVQNDSPEKKSLTLLYIGYHHWWNENYKEAIKFGHKSLEMAEITEIDSLRIRPLTLLSSSYAYDLNHEKFLSTNYGLLQLTEKYKTFFAYMEALNERGVYFLHTEHQDSSLFYLKKLSEVSKALDDKNFRAVTLFNLGYLCQKLELEERAVAYFNEAFKSANETGDSYTQFYVSIELYAHYHKNNLLDSAALYLDYADKSKSLYNFKSITFGYLLVQFRSNYLNKNLNGCDSLLSEMEKMDLNENLYFENAQFQLCKIKQEVLKGLFKEALQRISESETNLLHFYESVDHLDISKLKVMCYKALEDYKNAFKNSQKLKAITDSLNQPRNTARLLALKMEQEMEQEVQDLKESNEKSKLLVEKKTFQVIASLLGMIILFILLGIAYYMFSIKKQQTTKLKTMVAQRTIEIEKANSELKHKVKELTAFNHITSHDFKQPIRNISAFTSLLAVKKKNLLDYEAKEYLQFLEKSSKQLNNLLQSLEYYNSIESELNKEVMLVNVSLNDIISQSQDLVKVNKTMTIDLHSSISDIQITTEPNLLIIIIKNLLENGLKYNNSELKTVAISYTSSAIEHIISFKDNGIGIKPEFQEKIFSMFERLHSRNEYTGTGLGLAICSRLVNTLNGKISVKSELGNGATFNIHLPK